MSAKHKLDKLDAGFEVKVDHAAILNEARRRFEQKHYQQVQAFEQMVQDLELCPGCVEELRNINFKQFC